MSLSPWREFWKRLELHGFGEALLQLYLYGLFYSLPVVLTWTLLPQYFRGESRVLLSAWAGYTFFVFLPGILQGAARGLPFVAWLALSVLVALVAIPLIKKSRQALEHDASQETPCRRRRSMTSRYD